MPTAVAQLELPAETYALLERMAKTHHLTLSELVENLVRQRQRQDDLATLRQEYQRLTEKVLQRTSTSRERKRIEALCDQMNALQAELHRGGAWERRERQADALIAKSEALLEQARSPSTR